MSLLLFLLTDPALAQAWCSKTSSTPFAPLVLTDSSGATRDTWERYVYLDIDMDPATNDCVAVRVHAPDPADARHGGGELPRAPIVVEVPDFWIGNSYTAGFKDTQVPLLGAVYVSYLLPGAVSAPGVTPSGSGFGSDGTPGYGDSYDREVTAAVIEYAYGARADHEGDYITDEFPYADTDNVGLYAFSHPGMLATNTLVEHPSLITSDALKWFVGRENPTQDVLAPLELGRRYEDPPGTALFVDDPDTHAFDTAISTRAYSDSADYHRDGVDPDYTCVDWVWVSGQRYPGIYGRYLASCDWTSTPWVVGDPSVMAADVLLDGSRRHYSISLTSALNAVTTGFWPPNVATLSDVRATFPDVALVGRDGAGGWFNKYDDLPTDVDFRVLLLFDGDDHVQFVEGKPHIRHAFDGFSYAGYWVRLNQDEAYFDWANTHTAASCSAIANEHHANTQPVNWAAATYGGGYSVNDNCRSMHRLTAMGAMAEMMDRTEDGDWSNDLSGTLYSAPAP